MSAPYFEKQIFSSLEHIAKMSEYIREATSWKVDDKDVAHLHIIKKLQYYVEQERERLRFLEELASEHAKGDMLGKKKSKMVKKVKKVKLPLKEKGSDSSEDNDTCDNPHRIIVSQFCDCKRIAPELRYADMCNSCARLNNFDRSKAFH
jgi:hypothetical protein